MHEEVLPVPPTTINIIGSAGIGAFMPNPLAAGTGSLLVWKNDDLAPHHIVVSDGTDVGTIAPGESSVPIAISGGTVGYYCTFHPSMTGVISDPSVVGPDMPPDYAPPTYDPYDDYDYDYY
jgi:plastocyanin